MNLALILRSLPYLRWEQIVYRPWRAAQFNAYRLFPGLTKRWITEDKEAPVISPETVSTFRQVFHRDFAHLSAPPEEQHNRASALARGCFRFLNRTHKLTQIDWNQRYVSHLWNYQLHYFDYAVWCARAAVESGEPQAMLVCQRLIESWLEQACVGRSEGWDAYPTSLRIVNWIYVYALLDGRYADAGFLRGLRAGIYRQLDFLNGRLEHHLLANHLLKNVKALALGGLFFAREDWLKKGQRLLWRELDEQVLADGGHYERSPMYHAQALADFLECLALLRACNCLQRDGRAVAERLAAMAGFLEAMSYADGRLALFNDSANTAETSPQAILETARRVCGYARGSYPRSFPHTGYYLWEAADGRERIVIDAGEPAASYNAAHAHCDLLSYELWLAGRPFIVDAGVHGYGGDRFREYCRSTRAHNTVMFDGREQSELWGTFRLARRADAIRAEVANDENGWQFRGSYRPYFDRKLRHERTIRRAANGTWVVTDIAHGGGAQYADSFIHLHPEVQARPLDESSLTIECVAAGRIVWLEPFGFQSVELVAGAEATQASQLQGWHFPDFGVALPSPTVRFRSRAGEAFGYSIKTIKQ